MIFRRSYRISPDRDDWVAPEETLIDASSSLRTIEVPVGTRAFSVAFWVCCLALLGVLWGVGRLALSQSDQYVRISDRNRAVSVALSAPRGAIVDRNGIPLATNEASFNLLAVSRQLDRSGGRVQGLNHLALVLGESVASLSARVGDLGAQSAVFFVATDIDREQILRLTGAMPRGISIVTSSKRQYIDGPQFSHIVGYVGRVSKADMVRDTTYASSDTIGRLGVESSYEKYLRGTHGLIRAIAQEERIEQEEPTPGDTVTLSLDRAVQKSLYNSLWNMLRESGLSEAAAVAQNPSTGEVLGMVSFPTYDNNTFNRQLTQRDVEELFQNPRRPLFNRIISGRYNPGSTIKPFMGMAGLQEGIMRAHDIVTNECIRLSIPNPSDPSRPYEYDNWRPDTGPFDLRRAIAQSCNIYFYIVGGGYGQTKGLGVMRIAEYLHRAFADVVLGIDIPGEEAGFVPTPDWKELVKEEPWYQGDTFNISIGQGDLVVTPLWLNTYVSAIANGGTLWRPHVVDRVTSSDGTVLMDAQPEELGKLPFSPAVIALMQDAMRETVVSGTGKLLQDAGVDVSAKTGTAEVVKGGRINSLITVYAPAENPRIALTLLIEGSVSNQGYALRATRDFLRQYFGAPQTPSPTPESSPVPTP